MYPPLGNMDMPENFDHKDTFLAGRPRHDPDDPFRIRHPNMDSGRRAKIFAPFDALEGFDDAIREVNED